MKDLGTPSRNYMVDSFSTFWRIFDHFDLYETF